MRLFKNTIPLFLLFCFNTYAQFTQVKNFSLQDGLPNNYVYQISQDSLGYIWLGTGDGLIRVDESNFENKSLQKNATEKIIVTSFLNFNESVWYSDINGNIYEYEFDKINLYAQPIQQKYISTIALDASNILFVSPDQGASILDTKNKKIKKVILSQKHINSCYKHGNQIYVCTTKGISVFGIKDGLLKYHTSYIKDENVTCIAFTKDNNFYYGTESKGVFFYNTETKSSSSFGNNLFQIKSIVKHILIDSNKNLWVATFGQGTICYRSKISGEYSGVKIFQNQFENDFKYSTQIFEDYEKNIWISTYGNGINLLYNNNIHPFSNQNIKDGRVNAMVSTTENLYVNVDNLLIRIDENSQTDTLFALDKTIRVTSLEMGQNVLFIGTESDGLFYFHLTNRKLIKLEYDSHDISNKINDLLYLDNEIWIATYDGLFVFDLIKRSSIKYSTQNGLRHNLIYTLAALEDKTIIVGTKSNRLFFIKEGKITEKQLPTDNMIVSINSLKVIKSNKIAIGTLGNGLFIFENNKFKNFTVKDGLSSNFIFGMNEIDTNHILIFSETELSILNLTNSKISTMVGKNALTTSYIPNSDARFQNSEIFFGTQSKLYMFNSTKYLNEEFAPKLGFTLLKINDSIYNLSRVKNKISLPTGSYKIELDFKGVNFLHGEDLEYYYQLEGFDESWHLSKQSFALYKQLKYGKYRFAIKVCHKGECLEKRADFIIEINKPFWQSLWFIISCLLFLFWAIIIVFLLQERNNRRNKKILEYSIQLKNQELKLMDNDQTESLEFVSLVQNASKVRLTHFQSKDIDNFLIQKHKENLSSDFYWFEKRENKIIIFLFDNQKNGISAGVFNTWMVNILSNAVNGLNILDPKILIQHLSEIIKNNFTAKHFNHKLKISVAQINLESQELNICSTNQKSIVIGQNNESSVIFNECNFELDVLEIKNSIFDLKKLNSFYFLSDGLEKHSKIRWDEFINLINTSQTLDFLAEKATLVSYLNNLDNKNKALKDDFTCIGFKLKR